MPSYPKMNDAFRLMRKRGLLAFQNYECCQSCGGAAIASELEQRIKAAKINAGDFPGCCFFHQQDAEDRDAGRPFYLAYGPVWCTVPGESDDEERQLGLSDEEVGRIVCECLTEAGVKYEWDGKGSTRIRVTDPGGTKHEIAAEKQRQERARIAQVKEDVQQRAKALGMSIYPNSYEGNSTASVNVDDLAKLLDSYEAQRPKRRRKKVA